MMDLRLGDCLEVMATLPDASVDLVVTSPPYNLGNSPCATEHPTRGAGPTSALKWKGYGAFTDRLSEPEYQQQQRSALDHLYRVVKDGGSVFYQHADRMLDGSMISPLQWLHGSPFKIRQQVVWDKQRTHRWDGFYFAPSHEYVFWLTKGVFPTTRYRESIRRRRSVWDIAATSDRDHPAVYPVALATACVEAVSSVGDVVLDCYMGIGSTGLACIETGRHFIGIERDATYFAIAQQRIEKAAAALHQLELVP